MTRMLGVLGGMGPAATVDFMDKLTRLTVASCDQDHVPVIALSDPRIPDRSAAITENGPSPEPMLVACIHRLQSAGADVIAIPCNTVHYWFGALNKASRVPLLSIIDASIEAIVAAVPAGARVGILATEGTIVAKIYHNALTAAGFIPEALDPERRNRLVEAGIRCVKAGRVAAGLTLLEAALTELVAAGCQHAILGCTEVSVAFGDATARPGIALYDSNQSLAISALRHLGRATKPQVSV
ncbi:MAG: amino acid racemase [Alphaproteobacteria bacterium]